jgi:hypothetical protein
MSEVRAQTNMDIHVKSASFLSHFNHNVEYADGRY